MLLNQRSQLSLKNKLNLMMKTLISILLITTVLVLFGCDQKTAAVGKLDESKIKVGILILEAPRVIPPEADFKVIIKIVNTGDLVIPSLGKDGDFLKVGVTYHWKNMDESILVWDGLVTPLLSDLNVKSNLNTRNEQKMDVAVKSPSMSGRYILEIDLIQNSAFWFFGTGSQNARIIVDVI